VILATARITQAAYARRRGVSKNAVYAAVKGGRIHLVDGLIDPKQADRDWKANTDESKPKGRAKGAPRDAGGPASGTYSQHRQRTEDFRARLAEIAYGERVGALVDRKAYDQVHVERLKRAQKALLGIPARVGPVVAGISDPAECTKRVRTEIENVIRQIASFADES
jgi:hypothetical protein